VKRVAVFGNAGAGKSTLARRLANLTGIPLFPLDLLQWRPGDVKVPHEEYLEQHAQLLRRPAWIIDGYGCRKSAWDRFAAADTLVYIDLPLVTHAWWVTKRFFQSMFVPHEGWPAGSRILRSTLGCYRTMWLCHRRLTPDYRALVTASRGHKRVHHLKSAADIACFLQAMAEEVA